jgi:hypothetical protein
MIAVRRSGMQAISVTLFLGKDCFLVKAVMRCSIKNKISGFRCVDLGSVYFVREAGQEEEHDWGRSKARANVIRSQTIDLFT